MMMVLAAMLAGHVDVTGLRVVMMRDGFRAVRRRLDLRRRSVEVIGIDLLLGLDGKHIGATDSHQKQKCSNSLHISILLNAWLRMYRQSRFQNAWPPRKNFRTPQWLAAAEVGAIWAAAPDVA